VIESAKEHVMQWYDTIVSFFQTGGVFMYPIVIVLALGMAIAIERYVYLTLATVKNTVAWKQLRTSLESGDLNKAASFANQSQSAISKILNYGLMRAKTSHQRDDVEIAMEEGLMEILPRLEKRTHYLATFANLATLLGLLGTIIGLIEAFTAVSSANPAEKADLLSASISVAMNTTAFGLMVGIPLLLTHSILQSKTTQLVDSLEMASVKVLNFITVQAKTRQIVK
jgi:biopolymer transport protein ExbB/TolQ